MDLDFRFKEGQKLSVLIYDGFSELEAETIYKTLEKNWIEDTPIELRGSGFKLKIEDVEIRRIPDFETHGTHYKITVKGELI